MRVLENSPDRLVIEEKPWFLGLLLALFTLGFAAAALRSGFDGHWGAATMMAALSAGFALLGSWVIERVWLVLDRTLGTAELRRSGFWRYRRESYPLGSLADVELQSDFGDGTRTYRLVLRLKGAQAPVPMTRYFQSGRGAESCVAEARGWLAAAAGHLPPGTARQQA